MKMYVWQKKKRLRFEFMTTTIRRHTVMCIVRWIRIGNNSSTIDRVIWKKG